MSYTKITEADLTGKGVTGLPDTPNLSTSDMQAKFDELVKDVVVPKHNTLIDELEASTGASSVGAKDINGANSTVQNEFDNRYAKSEINVLLENKVDKEVGKGLSTFDFTKAYKNKLNGIEDNANNYVLPKGTQTTLGGVKGDGETFTIDENGVGHAIGGGGGGTANYNALVNKPTVNGVTVIGGKASEEYGLLRPYLVVTSEAGSTITISKGGKTITATQKSGSTTQWEVCPTSYGTWTVSSDLPDADIATTTIVIDAVKMYAITVEHIAATITATYQEGATCVCKKGTTVYTATSNPQTFTVRSIGNWTVETVYDGITKSVTVPISADEQTESVTLEYATIEVTYGNDFRGTTITCASGATVYSKTAPSSGNTVSFTIASTGTWVVSGTVSGDTYTRTQVVSNMTTYPVTLSVFNATVTVTFPYSKGASCTITDGVTTLTATTSPMAFNVPNAETWTATCTLGGISKTSSVEITTDGQTETMTIEFGTINLTFDNVFRGLTVTCANSGTTISKTAPISGNTMAFYPPNTGEWIISSTYSETPYQTSATITSLAVPVSASLTQVPDGKTVTPTDNIQKWLNCAGIFNKTSYTTLADVLEDSTTLLALISNNNASDYLVRSTTWDTSLCADSNAMADIGANDYCANKLLSDSTWLTAISSSTYFESVLNTKVPTMTSATTPSGEVKESSSWNDNSGYLAFDNNSSTGWIICVGPVGEYLQYNFTSKMLLKKVHLVRTSEDYVSSFKIQGSNDETDWYDLYTGGGLPVTTDFNVSGNTEYKYFKFLVTGDKGSPGIVKLQLISLQFYGRASS